MPPTKVIFDTDPGVDDAMALLFLHLHPAIDLVGVTTVLGNATIEQTTFNALYLKQRFAIPAPVARGAGQPLLRDADEPPTFVHGHNGLGDIALPERLAVAAIEQTAHRLIIDTVRQNPHQITIVAVGRMTNLALALQEAPDIAGLVREVVIMGGGFGRNGAGRHSTGGNVTPVAEANIHGDPEAADMMFGAAWPITVVGLDVTLQVRMDDAYLAVLRDQGGEAGRFIWDISRFYTAFYSARAGIEGCFVHDSSAVAYLIDRSLFRTERGGIRVVSGGIADGQTILAPEGQSFAPGAWDGRPVHSVCFGVDAPAVLDLYRRTIIGA